MKLFSGITIILIQLILLNPVCAIEIKDRNEFLLDVRRDDNIYLNRLSACEKSDPLDMELTAFVETQWNFGENDWDKITAGGEIGKYLWKYLYAGQSVQLINGLMLDYMTFNPSNTSFETVTKFDFKLPVLKNIFKENLSLRLWEEYSYNLEEGAAGLNEVGIETVYDLTKNASVTLGWRHSDRIHNFDSDYVSSSLAFLF